MRLLGPIVVLGATLTVFGCAAGQHRPGVTPVTPPTSSAAPTSSAPPATASSAPPATASRAGPPAASNGARLPLDQPTGDARQVITVVTPSYSSTTAVLQAWQRGSSGWIRVGPAVAANLGSAGSTVQPRESLSATPIGSFTLTRAFGHDRNPGAHLPYTPTTPADWWISQPGPLYNTLVQCFSNCSFTRGDPNEHVYYETPAYDYAVVIDYNTANAPGGVKQGGGSAFFLHVSEGRPTAGCISIAKSDLVAFLRWLTPSAHPRIVIGI